MYKYNIHTNLAKDLNNWDNGWWNTPTAIQFKKQQVTKRKQQQQWNIHKTEIVN